MPLLQELALILCVYRAWKPSDRGRGALLKLDIEGTCALFVRTALANIDRNVGRSACFDDKAHRASKRGLATFHRKIDGGGEMNEDDVAGKLQLACSAFRSARLTNASASRLDTIRQSTPRNSCTSPVGPAASWEKSPPCTKTCGSIVQKSCYPCSHVPTRNQGTTDVTAAFGRPLRARLAKRNVGSVRH
jgi:hypothetical protein